MVVGVVVVVGSAVPVLVGVAVGGGLVMTTASGGAPVIDWAADGLDPDSGVE